MPVPIGPAKIRFSGAVTHSPRASVWICVALTPSAVVKSKRVEGLHLGKARLAQPLADDGLVARGLLGGEHLVEIILVRPMRIARLTRQGFKGARDAGQFQRARLRDDEIAGEGGGAHAAPPRSQAS